MTFQTSARPLLCALALASLALVPMRGDTVLYSTGFEAPTFTSGATVSGQDGWSTYQTSDASNVENTFAQTGSQAVAVTSSQATSGQTGPYHQNVSSGPLVDLSADLYLASSSTETSWQFAGLGPGLLSFLGGFDISRNTGTITMITSATGTPSAGTFTRDVWHHVDLLFDITTQTYNFTLDGTVVANNLPFCGGTGCVGSDATFNYGLFDTFAGIANENDTGYIDNYSVTQLNGVPEPASIGLIALAGLLALGVGRIRGPGGRVKRSST